MSKNKGSGPFRPDDALSLHSQHGSGSGIRGPDVPRRQLGDLDDDNDNDNDTPDQLFDDLPPLYSDIGTDGGPAWDAAVSVSAADDSLLPVGDDGYIRVRGVVLESTMRGDGQPVRSAILPNSIGWHDLAAEVTTWARRPPRPYLRLYGTHTEMTDRDGKKENRKVVDFDVRLDLTPYLYADAYMRRAWCTVSTANEYAHVRRGTVFRCQDPAVKKGRRHTVEDVEQQQQQEQQPLAVEETEREPETGGELKAWCRRYCADASALKCFTLERQMAGFDYDRVRDLMETLVRRTSYHGTLSVSFPVNEARLDLYNDHRLNRWRLVRWIQVLCALTLMLVFTWPYLFFRTRRYEVVTSCWHFSRLGDHGTEYVSLSENQLYNLWARAISRAVLDKRQTVLDQEDLRAAEGAAPTFHSGSGSVDDAVGLLQAGISAMNHVNRQFGWGRDC